MVALGRVRALAEHLTQEFLGLFGAASGDLSATYAQHQVGIFRRLRQRALVLFERFFGAAGSLEQQAALQREAWVLFVDAGYLVEGFARLFEFAITAQGNAQAKTRTQILAIEREG